MAVDNVRETYSESVSEVNEVGNVNASTIGESIKNLSQEMDKYKFEMFKNSFKRDDIDLSQISNVSDIPNDLKGEYSNFKLSNEQIMASDSPYSSAKTKVIQTLEDRDKKINKLIGEKEDERKGELTELLDEAEKTLEETKKELDNVEKDIEELQSRNPLTDEDKSRLDDLNEKKSRLNEDISYLEGITGKSKSDGTRSIQDLIEDCTISSKATQSTKKEAIKALGSIVGPYALEGENIVYADKDISSSLGEYDKEKDFLNNVSKKVDDINKEGDTQKENEQEEPQEKVAKAAQQKAGAIPPDAAAKLAQQMASNGKSGISSDSVVGGDGLEEELKNLEPDYLSLLGYNPNNTLDFENSSVLLTNFANDFTDKARLEMLNSPECKNVILKALAITGKNLNPKKAKLFNDTRYKILKLAKGPMMEMALKNIGIENPEDIKKEFNKANKLYNSSKKDLESKLKDTSLTDEERQKAQNDLDELNLKYESIRNVADFQKSSNKIKTIRSRIISFKDAILTKDTYKQTVMALGEKAEGAKEKVNDFLFEKTPEKDTRENNWKDMVNDPKSRVAAEVNRMQSKKVEKAEQNKDNLNR